MQAMTWRVNGLALFGTFAILTLWRLVDAQAGFSKVHQIFLTSSDFEVTPPLFIKHFVNFTDKLKAILYSKLVKLWTHYICLPDRDAMFVSLLLLSLTSPSTHV